jgi:hypothetical protein
MGLENHIHPGDDGEGITTDEAPWRFEDSPKAEEILESHTTPTSFSKSPSRWS